MLGRAPLLVTALLLTINSAFALAADDPKEVLKDSGLKVVGDYAVQVDEAKVVKALTELTKAKKQLIDAAKARAVVEYQVAQNRAMIEQLGQTRRQGNAQLANPNINVQQNNQIVSNLNELDEQIRDLAEQSKKLEEASKKSRAAANQVREEYVEKTMSSRKLYDEIIARYEELEKDEAVKEALIAVSGAKPLKLGPTKSFTQNDEKIKKVEDTVLSENIPLRNEGKVWFTSVVVNGTDAQEFCVDTGASLLSIPFNLAKAMKLEPTSSSQKLRLSLADGRVIEASLVIAKSVRVGKFTVENVECAVLPETAVNADPLLGQSFLEKFSFQIDSAAGQLVMTKVDGEEAGAKAAPKLREKVTKPPKGAKGKGRDPFLDPPSLD